MSRPVGVTLIGVLDFLGMAIQIALGVGGLIGMSFLGALITKLAAQSSQQLPPGTNITAAMAGAGIMIAIGAFMFALVSALIGWGMLALKNWARILSIIYSSIGVLCFGLGILGTLLRFSLIGFLWDASWLVINALIIWYLLQGQVRAAFAAQPRPMAATA
jgi:hypothetical protein